MFILIILFRRQLIREGKCVSNVKIHEGVKGNGIASIAIGTVVDVVLLQETASYFVWIRRFERNGSKFFCKNIFSLSSPI